MESTQDIDRPSASYAPAECVAEPEAAASPALRNAPQIVLREIGLILVIALVGALAVNVALAALHVG